MTKEEIYEFCDFAKTMVSVSKVTGAIIPPDTLEKAIKIIHELLESSDNHNAHLYKVIYEDETSEDLYLDDDDFIKTMYKLLMIKEKLTKPIRSLIQY